MSAIFKIVGFLKIDNTKQTLAEADNYSEAHELLAKFKLYVTHRNVQLARRGDELYGQFGNVVVSERLKPSVKLLILQAARTIRQSEFTLSQLVLACWMLDPRQFGMPGYRADYPDTHQVLPSLCGYRGLVTDGRLLRVRPGVYALSKGEQSVE